MDDSVHLVSSFQALYATPALGLLCVTWKFALKP